MVTWLAKWGSKGGKKVLETLVPKPAKNLTERKKAVDDMISTVNKQFKSADLKPGSEASKLKKKFWRKSSDIHDKYEKAVKAADKKVKSHNRKVIGTGAATVAGAVGAMEVGKRKSPKFKKFIESSVTIKDGKLGLKPKKD